MQLIEELNSDCQLDIIFKFHLSLRRINLVTQNYAGKEFIALHTI